MAKKVEKKEQVELICVKPIPLSVYNNIDDHLLNFYVVSLNEVDEVPQKYDAIDFITSEETRNSVYCTRIIKKVTPMVMDKNIYCLLELED